MEEAHPLVSYQRTTDDSAELSRVTVVMSFDFVVTWLEFGPWFVWLAWEQAAIQTWSKRG